MIPRTPLKTAGRLPVPVGFVLHGMQVAGAEVLVKEIIAGLGPSISPTVFCLDTVGPLGEELQAQGIEVLNLERWQGRDWQLPWRLARHIRRRGIEVVHAHQYGPFFYAALAKVCSACRCRLIFTEHGRHFPDVVSPLRRAVNRLLLARLADAVNAVSAFSAASVARQEGFAGKQIEVIANGADLKQFQNLPSRQEICARLGLDPARRFVIHVARLHPVKDQATLLSAFVKVAAGQRDADLLLAGDGPLRRQLEQQAVDLSLQGRAHFLGVRADIPAILSIGEAFVLTSRTEAAPLTVLEAMASGLPVVAPAVGGIAEMVRTGQEGYLVPQGNADETAAALLRLLADPVRARQMGAAGRQRVEQHFRIEQTVELYGNLYRRLARHA